MQLSGTSSTDVVLQITKRCRPNDATPTNSGTIKHVAVAVANHVSSKLVPQMPWCLLNYPIEDVAIVVRLSAVDYFYIPYLITSNSFLLNPVSQSIVVVSFPTIFTFFPLYRPCFAHARLCTERAEQTMSTRTSICPG